MFDLEITEALLTGHTEGCIISLLDMPEVPRPSADKMGHNVSC